jgi:pyruvate formate lyase activating enzyme
MFREAYLARPLSGDTVQCQACEHFCAVKPGEAGKCGVRRNIDGTLTLVVYAAPVAVHVDPIEKKPLFHFLPQNDALSIGTYGCNFFCGFCQNWQMSQTRDMSAAALRATEEATPEALVRTCVANGIPIIAYTYNEPTVFFEYTLDTARLAQEHGIRNVYVSNGYMSERALDTIEPYLDAINVDLKAFTEEFYQTHCGARLAPVLRNIAHIARDTGIWIEVTTLLIPGANDSDEELRELAGWLAEVDPQVPWHVSRFHPDYHMLDRRATPPASLVRAYEIGRQAGLQYVYLGNVLDAEREATACPGCGRRLIERAGYRVRPTWERPGVCPQCGGPIAGVWS